MKHTRMLFAFDGMGGWRVQPSGVETVVKEAGIQDLLLFEEYLEICASILFKQDEKENDNDSITEEEAIEESP